MLLKEIKLPELRTKATSNLTAKHLNARYDNDFYYTVTFAFVQLKGNLVSRFSRFLRGAQNTPNTLTVLYTVNATFGDGKSVPNNIYPSEPNKYHVVIQFQNIQVAEQASGLKWTQFLSAPDQKKQQMIQTVINSCDVKLYSDDPSFYWQGVHEILDKHGVALYPFRGTPGDGQWEARHQGSGGLSGNIYVTKHIAQISEQISSDWRDIVKSIQKNQSIQESFNYDFILSKRLSEKNTLNYQYIFQETYEKDYECLLNEDTKIRLTEQTLKPFVILLADILIDKYRGDKSKYVKASDQPEVKDDYDLREIRTKRRYDTQSLKNEYNKIGQFETTIDENGHLKYKTRRGLDGKLYKIPKKSTFQIMDYNGYVFDNIFDKRSFPNNVITNSTVLLKKVKQYLDLNDTKDLSEATIQNIGWLRDNWKVKRGRVLELCKEFLGKKDFK